MREISSVKKQMVADIKDIVTTSTASYLVTYKGLTVAAFSELRSSLDAIQAQVHVVPNALMAIAIEELGLATRDAITLKCDTALVTGGTDPLQVAKILKDFQKKNEVVSSKFGFLDGEMISASDIETLASIPSREVLYAMILGLLQSAPRGLVCVLNAKAKEMESAS